MPKDNKNNSDIIKEIDFSHVPVGEDELSDKATLIEPMIASAFDHVLRSVNPSSNK